MIKRLSLVKIIVALCICNVYVFTCGVVGAVGDNSPTASESANKPADSDIDNPGANGFGTQDFLTSDSMVTEPSAPSSSHEVIETPGFAKPTLMQVPVSSTFRPSDLTNKYPVNGSSGSSGGSSSSEPDEPPVIVDTYEPSSSSTVSEPEPSRPEPPQSSSKPPVSSSDKPESSSSTPQSSSSDTSQSSSSSSDIPMQPNETISNTEAANRILTVSDNGAIVSGTALDIVSRIVMTEVGSTFAPEAIKAQAVASYTYVKYFNDRGSSPSVILSDNVNDSVRVLVGSVIGQSIYYNGAVIQATYSASSAGYTASSKNVWGTDLPYLQSVYCELDEKYDPNYGRTKTFSSGDMKSRVYNTTGISLSGNPASWFAIEDYTEGKYVGKMSIGGYHTYIANDGSTVTLTGRVFRERVMRFDIRSNAFDISYNADTDEFTVTTYGYGHGVGMSQNGANNLARYWSWDYKQILEFYYQGTKVQ